MSSRSRRQKGILVFLAQDAERRVPRYANAGVTKAGQAGEILRFVEFWNKHTGSLPAELVFDSQLTTYEKLSELNLQGISFIPRAAALAGCWGRSTAGRLRNGNASACPP